MKIKSAVIGVAFLLIFFILNSGCTTHNKIVFTVTDQQTKMPVEGAVIELSALEDKYVTDKNGNAVVILEAGDKPYSVIVRKAWNNISEHSITLTSDSKKVMLEAGDSEEFKLAGERLKTRNSHVHLMDDWMRDPYVYIGPDNKYYLTFTQHNGDSLNRGMPVFWSNDLHSWYSMGTPYSIKNLSYWNDFLEKKNGNEKAVNLWAPELFFMNGRWVITHTSNCGIGTMAFSQGAQLQPPYTDWGTNVFNRRHDPSIFTDDDGSNWLVYAATRLIKIKDDWSGFEGEVISVKPSDRKIGHEGSQIIKVGNKYVLFGTAWSRDKLRHGTYNLYYCTADSLTGPYGPRHFAGRCLGHGTVFKDKEGQWWCTAFLNGKYLSPESVASKSINPDIAISMNKQGLTLVPMEIKEVDGEVWVRPLDSKYRYPGDEEIQKFTYLNFSK